MSKPLKLSLQPNSHTPIYRQIAQQVTDRALGGGLEAGEQLPSVRQLAHSLLVNPNTVARAYRELERDGVVVARPGSGVYIADQKNRFRDRHRKRMLHDNVDRLLEQARNVGVSLAELQALIVERAEADADASGDDARRRA